MSCLKLSKNLDRIAQMNLTRLSNLLSKFSKRHFIQSHAVQLKELASHPVGTKNDTLPLQIFQSIQPIEMYTEQLAEVEASIHEVMKRMDSVIKNNP